MGRYDKLNIQNKNGKGLVYYSQLLPYIEPSDSDVVIITEEEDRLDILANQFYRDPNLWWVIAVYNNMTDIDLKLEPGIQLRIPNRASVVTQLF